MNLANFASLRRSLLHIEAAPARKGSGFLLTGNLIVTAAHVSIAVPISQVDGRDFFIRVRSASTNTSAACDVIFYEPKSDLMLLSSPGHRIENAVDLGADSDSLLRGLAPLDLYTGEPPSKDFEVFMPTPRGSVISGTATISRGGENLAARELSINIKEGEVFAGDSGSPIITADDRVISLLQSTTHSGNIAFGYLLEDVLPGWVVKAASRKAVAPNFKEVIKSRWRVNDAQLNRVLK